MCVCVHTGGECVYVCVCTLEVSVCVCGLTVELLLSVSADNRRLPAARLWELMVLEVESYCDFFFHGGKIHTWMRSFVLRLDKQEGQNRSAPAGGWRDNILLSLVFLLIPASGL